MGVPVTTRHDIEGRAGLLAVADRGELVDLAERCIELHGAPTLIAPPETGLVMMQVREPVVRERFHLGEVLVTRCEVELLGERGWAMRMGGDRVATLAAAVCDAVARSGAEGALDVDVLCDLTAHHRQRDERAEWAALADTIVSFEELDA